MYELGTFCTSIICQDANGMIIHGRNLDWSMQPYLANMSIIGNFYKNGSLLFKSDMIVGYLGILTGMKPNSFSITLNQRETNQTIWDNIYYFIYDHAYPDTYFLRLVLQNNMTYE